MKKLIRIQKACGFSFILFLLGATAACTSAANANIPVNTSNSTVNSTINTTANSNTNGTSESANSAEQKMSPDALVADLYKQHDAKRSPFFQNKNRALLDKYFTRSLADMIWKDITTTKPGEVGALDFDPLYNAQDVHIKNLKVGQAEIQNDTAKVPVNFTNMTTKETVNFALVKENGDWKIKDILYGDFTLASVYKENEKAGSDTKDSSPTGEFEGKYQIGDTTCTVTPIKMAFEVKWAKGTGTEIFFSQDNADGKYSFVSDPKTGKPNKFSFGDENYNAGTFYRADGKEFPIKRIK